MGRFETPFGFRLDFKTRLGRPCFLISTITVSVNHSVRKQSYSRERGMGPKNDDQVAEFGWVFGDEPRRRLVGAHAEHACQVRVEQAAQELHLPRRVCVARLGRHAPVVGYADVHRLADDHLSQVGVA